MAPAFNITETVKKDILSVLKDAVKAIKSDNVLLLKEVSDHTLHNSSINQDQYSILTAIITYMLAKIFERTRYREYDTWSLFYKTTLDNLELAVDSLQKNEFEKFDHAIHSLMQAMNRMEYKFKQHIKDVLEKAKVSKASRIYEHGISAGRTAELLGISEWELMAYTGQTGIADVQLSQTRSIKDRIRFTRSLFQ